EQLLGDGILASETLHHPHASLERDNRFNKDRRSDDRQHEIASPRRCHREPDAPLAAPSGSSSGAIPAGLRIKTSGEPVTAIPALTPREHPTLALSRSRRTRGSVASAARSLGSARVSLFKKASRRPPDTAAPRLLPPANPRFFSLSTRRTQGKSSR